MVLLQRLLKWVPGRQLSGYWKLLLIQSRFFKFDCYIIKIDAGVAIPWHVDNAPHGYTHYRLNITLVKSKCGGKFVTERRPIFSTRTWDGRGRVVFFRANDGLHSLTAPSEPMYLFFNWLALERSVMRRLTLYVFHQELSLSEGFDLLENWRETPMKVLDEHTCGKPSGRELFRSLAKSGPEIKCFMCGMVADRWIIDYSARHVIRNKKIVNMRMNLFGLRNGRLTMMTQDHIIPASHGGMKVLENLRPACETCNSQRGNKMTPDEVKFKENNPHLLKHVHERQMAHAKRLREKRKKKHAERHESPANGARASRKSSKVSPCSSIEALQPAG